MKSLLNTLFISALFLGCQSYEKISLFPQEFDTLKTLNTWENLLLKEDEYPKDAELSSFKHSYYLDRFKSQNPGFIDLEKFRNSFKEHPLQHLRHWYEATFYLENSIIHYMIMQFQTVQEAQEYLPRLRADSDQKALKILRLDETLFSFQIHDVHGALRDQDTNDTAYQWMLQTATKIRERL